EPFGDSLLALLHHGFHLLPVAERRQRGATCGGVNGGVLRPSGARRIA
ncbi:MAG: hypothetical protein RLZZ551_1425, partial [Actinomycetota bacterium]